MLEEIEPKFQDAVIQTFLRDRTLSLDSFHSVICERDEMYLFALNNARGDKTKAYIRYYSNGRRILDAVKQIVNGYFVDFSHISAFLDFACGYGRLTRFLIQELPPEKVWVSDIYFDAVKFQVEQFGVNGINSSLSPDDYQCDRTFDCILASSFFSHIPERTFTHWFAKLYSLLSPNGLLIFSVHDISLSPQQVESGFHFIPQSESQSLEGEDYGTTYVSENFIQQVLVQITDNPVYHRIPQGLCRHQDLYLVAKQPTRNFENLKFSHHPEGRLETCLQVEDKIELSGVVSEFNPNSQIKDIQIWVNDRLVQRCLPWGETWTCQINPAQILPEDVVLVKAINSRGLERVLAVDTLNSLLQEPATPVESTILIVIGMHRSGTSLTASLLQDVGVDLGDRLVGEDVGNEKGHFEDLDFVELHKNILRSQGADLDGLTLQTEIPVLDRYTELANKLIEKNSVHPLWGWKDPRTTLFLDFWQELLPQAKFILVYRSPWEVVDSLYRRGTDELIEAYPERAVQLWIHYNQKMLDFYNRVPEQCFLVNLSYIASHPAEFIEAIAQKFQLSLKPPSPDIIESGLLGDRVSKTHRPVLIEQFYPEAIALYRELDAKAVPFNGDSNYPWTKYASSSPKNWGFQDWLEVGRLYRERRKLKIELQRNQAELQKTQADLQQTQSQIQQFVADKQQIQEIAEQLNAELVDVRSQLQQAQATVANIQSERQSQLQSQLEQVQIELQHARGIIAAMQTSKFWKFRRQWFKLKKLAGLPLNEDVE